MCLHADVAIRGTVRDRMDRRVRREIARQQGPQASLCVGTVHVESGAPVKGAGGERNSVRATAGVAGNIELHKMAGIDLIRIVRI